MNAIILAAGMGTRLRPLTNDIPKCLVPVSGTPFIERQIQFLHESSVTDITLVSGYKAEKLDYLKEKYNVKIIHNDKYDVFNNIYSLYLVRHLFSDSFVIEGDVFMNSNCFPASITTSTYFSKHKDNYKNEWKLVLNGNKLKEVVIGSGSGYIMSGISYWTANDAKKITSEIERLVTEEDFKDLFWDNAVLNIYPTLDICVKGVEDIYEIDTVAELEELEKSLE
ncbi:CTP--phosphocholine cytidylyltransferase [Prevotella sp. HUN102]|uniref:CTP--phosphocholine cytidylyltransferase n=1 Tax=Prevotella sp. HUN102 TaxID=1392486 RepID=UPI00049133DA|nr:CTP--phosphocholine cytidylyltransferase [Prevotella sp. HUN102]